MDSRARYHHYEPIYLVRQACPKPTEGFTTNGAGLLFAHPEFVEEQPAFQAVEFLV